MQHWMEFYAVIGAAAAGLLGLLFVTISTNVQATLGVGNENLKRMAEQAFQNYLAVLMVSLVALFPHVSLPTFGFVTLCVIALWVIWVLLRFYMTIVQPLEEEGRLHILRRHVSSLIGFAILVVTALRMALRWGDDLNWFAAGNIILLFSATTSSWQFLVRTAHHPGTGLDGSTRLPRSRS